MLGLGGLVAATRGSTKTSVTSASRFGAENARQAFKHGYTYHPRVRQRAVEDPRAHNFPHSFDDVILRETLITQRMGRCSTERLER